MLTNSEVNEMIREETLRGHRQSEHLRKAIMPTRTKRLPCGRTKAELAKDKKRLQKLIEIIEAAERGDVIEHRPDDKCAWRVDLFFDPIGYALFQYRIAKPKRGAK